MLREEIVQLLNLVLGTTCLDYSWMLDYDGFHSFIQNIRELDCYFLNGFEFFDRLARSCRNIQVLKIKVDINSSIEDEIDRNLTQRTRSNQETSHSCEQMSNFVSGIQKGSCNSFKFNNLL
ncbi:6695_t:CDS:2 [Entrophospora sp. SA101]|nr:6695_t:CDS:2 [Entrophospora sp. SA101]